MSADQPSAAEGSPLPRNQVSGAITGAAIQAGRIHGNVSISLAQPAASRAPVPAQLPPAPANFTGRVAELARLNALAADGDPARRVVMAVLSGIGGSGKSSLASHWLHRLSVGDEDGALYADLRGHRPDDAASPADVLAGFLRALAVPPAQIPLDPGELAAMFRTVTSGRRMLVLLDNAASAAQVRALLPGPGPRAAAGEEPGQPSVVVVTTRWRLAGLATEGAHFIDVGPLDEETSAALLARMAGAGRVAAEPDATRVVVRLCAGLPLALCVAGALVAARSRRSLGELAAELAARQQRLAALTVDDLSVSAAFDTMYQALPASVARGYRVLAAIPGPDFGLGVAAACIGGDGDAARDVTSALASASLLQETAGERFRYHDLVKLHALEQGRQQAADEPRAAAATAIEWYLEHAIAADLVVIAGRWRLNPAYERARAGPPAFPGPSPALVWLESEQDCLTAAVAAAHDLGLPRLAWQLCEALWGLFANRSYFQPWIESHHTGIAAARADGDRRAEARMRMQLGVAFRRLRRLDAAREQYELALALDQADGHRLGEATELEQLGLVDLAERRYAAAIGSFSRAEGIFREVTVPRGAAMMTCHVGEAHRDAGRYPEAIGELTRARGLFAALPDHYNEARATGELGRAYLLAGQPAEASGHLASALAAMVALDSPYEQARIHVALAGVAVLLGDAGDARRHWQLALAVYESLGAPEAGQVRLALAGSGAPGSPGDGPAPPAGQ